MGLFSNEPKRKNTLATRVKKLEAKVRKKEEIAALKAREAKAKKALSKL